VENISLLFNIRDLIHVCSSAKTDKKPPENKRPSKDTVMVSSEGLSCIAFLFDYLPSISSFYQINRADLG
jgi:hypothetical protein